MNKLDSILKTLQTDIAQRHPIRITHKDIPKMRKQNLNDIQRFQIDMIDADVIDRNYNNASFDFYELYKMSHQ